MPIEDFKDLPAPITFSWIDHNNHIWLCNEETIFLYNTRTEEVTHVKNCLSEAINDIEQIDESHYFIGTEMGIHHAQLKNNTLQLLPCDKLDNVNIQVNDLHFDPKIRKLFIGAFERGVMVYDMNTKNHHTTGSQPERRKYITHQTTECQRTADCYRWRRYL